MRKNVNNDVSKDSPIGTNSKTTYYLLSYTFRLNTLKGAVKAPAVDLLRLNTLRGTKIAFLTLKRYVKHPRLFYQEVPPSPISAVICISHYTLMFSFLTV